MNLGDIRQEVENIVQDRSFDHDAITGYINQSIIHAAGLTALPGLKRVGLISTTPGVSYVSVTVTLTQFSGMLKMVRKANGSEPNIYSKLELMLSDYSDLDEVGEVEAVCLENPILWYTKVPAVAEVLTLVYYLNPSFLEEDTDIPTDFPEYLHRKLFVNGAVYFIYDQIEEEVEGKKINTTNYYWQSFSEDNKESGIIKLKEWISRQRIPYISSCWRA